MEQSFTSTIVEGLAQADEVSVENLEYRIHDYFDADILTSLEKQENATWSLTFSVAEHEVHVDSVGTVSIDGTEISSVSPQTF